MGRETPVETIKREFYESLTPEKKDKIVEEWFAAKMGYGPAITFSQAAAVVSAFSVSSIGFSLLVGCSGGLPF